MLIQRKHIQYQNPTPFIITTNLNDSSPRAVPNNLILVPREVPFSEDLYSVDEAMDIDTSPFWQHISFVSQPSFMSSETIELCCNYKLRTRDEKKLTRVKEPMYIC